MFRYYIPKILHFQAFSCFSTFHINSALSFVIFRHYAQIVCHFGYKNHYFNNAKLNLDDIIMHKIPSSIFSGIDQII